MIRITVTAVALLLCLNSAHAAEGGPGGIDPKGQDAGSAANRKPPTPEEALALFTEDLTAKAQDGRTSNFVGGRSQVQKIMQVLSKANTRVMFLLGERGSGKTELVEAAAGLIDGRIYSLKISALFSGTTYRGQLEENIQALLTAFRDPKRILFIDEVAELSLPGRETLRNELLPPMARGELSVIMATTDDEFAVSIEPDKALTSRGVIERLDSPDEKKILDVLRARKAQVQNHHGIPITDGALKMTAKLVMRYYFDDARLRRAIDIIDGAAAQAVLVKKLGNYDLASLKDQRESLELHLRSLDDDIKTRSTPELLQERKDVAQELAGFDQKINQEQPSAELEKLQKQLEKAQYDADNLQKRGEFNAASELKYKIIPDLEKQLKALNVEPETIQEEVTEKEIARFVAQEKRISLNLVSADSAERLKLLETDMNKSVLFQDHAISLIVQATKIRLANVEKAGPNFILLDGPTGVGKSEVVRSFSRSFYGTDPLVIAGNKYQGGNSSWQLIGSGKGYKDAETGGDLEPLRRNPEIVVSIDEANLADPSFWQAMYQLASEGYLTDNRGRTIDARNATVLIQGNFTGEYAVYRDIWTQKQIEERFRMPAGSLNGLSKNEIDEAVIDRALALHGVDAPMRGRLQKVLFHALDLQKSTSIAQLKLNEQKDYIYKEHNGVIVNFEPNVAEAIAKTGFDLEMGARPIDRARKFNVSDLLADVAPSFRPGLVINVGFKTNDEGTGGTLIVKTDTDTKTKELVFKTAVDPRLALAAELGHAGHEIKEVDPTDHDQKEFDFARPE